MKCWKNVLLFNFDFLVQFSEAPPGGLHFYRRQLRFAYKAASAHHHLHVVSSRAMSCFTMSYATHLFSSKTHMRRCRKTTAIMSRVRKQLCWLNKSGNEWVSLSHIMGFAELPIVPRVKMFYDYDHFHVSVKVRNWIQQTDGLIFFFFSSFEEFKTSDI